MPAPSHQANSFDAMRIAAALMVVVGHIYVLSGRTAEEPLLRYTGLGGLGELGVSIFFVVSGFLVTASYRRLGSVRAYMLHRALRILPGLAVAVSLCALVLGPAVTTVPLGAYFGDPRTWLYPVRNLLLYPVTYLLPGVFAANPYPDAVNGSLWTLRLEFTLYLLPPLLAWPGLLSRAGLAWAAGLAGLAYLALLWAGPGHVPAIALIGARNGYLFVAGAALFAWAERLRPERAAVLAPALAVFCLAALSRTAAPAFCVLIAPLAVVGLGLSRPRGLAGPMRFGDLSYGIYIYAFPVQQALMQAFGPKMGLGAFLAATLACVLPLAAASWWLVERPALRLKRRVDRLGPPSASQPQAALTPVGLS
jgi:peptidoglycan/LPS O-acetylase OafA/YrhL